MGRKGRGPATLWEVGSVSWARGSGKEASTLSAAATRPVIMLVRRCMIEKDSA